MFNYGLITNILIEHKDVIKGKDKKKAEKFLEAYSKKDCDTMDRILGYWQHSNNVILQLFNMDNHSLMDSSRRKLIYKILR